MGWVGRGGVVRHVGTFPEPTDDELAAYGYTPPSPVSAEKRDRVLDLLQRGMSQRAVADAVGIARSTVIRIARAPHPAPA